MIVPIQFPEKLYSVKEAAKLLGVTPGRIRQLVIERRIRAIRLSHELIIPHREIERYNQSRRPYRKSHSQNNL